MRSTELKKNIKNDIIHINELIDIITNNSNVDKNTYLNDIKLLIRYSLKYYTVFDLISYRILNSLIYILKDIKSQLCISLSTLNILKDIY